VRLFQVLVIIQYYYYTDIDALADRASIVYDHMALKLGELLPSSKGSSENRLTNGLRALLLANCFNKTPFVSLIYFLLEDFG
jgi:hypothetical protein